MTVSFSPGLTAGPIARLLGIIGYLLVAHGAAAQAISEAETLLFQTNHLKQVSPPARLTYTFRKVSNVEPGFEDGVRVDVSSSKGDAAAVVAMQFLSGSRKRPTPELENPQGNPVLLGFLERDIAEMKRLTGGATNYFRKRIRLALAESASVTGYSFTFHGKPMQGKVVRIQPYLGDPLHERFEKYVNKSYVFVLSDQLPGGIYQLKTSLSSPAGTMPVAGRAVMDETLTLDKVDKGKR
jgi:hypothetical protein